MIRLLGGFQEETNSLQPNLAYMVVWPIRIQEVNAGKN